MPEFSLEFFYGFAFVKKVNDFFDRLFSFAGVVDMFAHNSPVTGMLLSYVLIFISLL